MIFCGRNRNGHGLDETSLQCCPIFCGRNESIHSLDETFWERAFTLNAPSPPHRELSNTSLSSAGLCAEEEEWERAFEDVLEATPKFLRPVMRDVMLTGKSMELLQALGRLPEVLASVGDGCELGVCLFEDFLGESGVRCFLGAYLLPSKSRVKP